MLSGERSAHVSCLVEKRAEHTMPPFWDGARAKGVAKLHLRQRREVVKTARGVRVELVGRDCLSDLRNGQRTGRGVLHR
jgi:hypothetical protein